MRIARDNGLRFYLYCIYRNKSEKRLNSVKNGQVLSKAVAETAIMTENLEVLKDPGASYEKFDILLHRKADKLPNNLTPAMKEYVSTKLYSPLLEQKKSQNISKFFLVRNMKEKYQIINSIFHENHSKPMFPNTSRVEEKKTGENNDKVKEKERVIDPFEKRIRQIDEKIKKTVEIDVKQDKIKRNEQERKAFNFNFNKKPKKGHLSDRFYALNMKAKHKLDHISQSLYNKPELELRKSFL